MGYRGTESHLKPRETEDCICKVYIDDLNSGWKLLFMDLATTKHAIQKNIYIFTDIIE